MGGIQVQVCLISARGLRRTSPFWKLQWYAVAWIYPDNKYCTKIDATGSGNPVWKTGFSAAIDPSELNNIQELVLHVEVYSREPVFLRNSLHGSATVVLKEFMEKYGKESEDARKPVEEVGSFQLRKKKSDKPVGFVDLSIRISEEREEPGSSYLGPGEGFDLTQTNASGSLQPMRPTPMPFPPNYPQHQLGGGSHPAAVQASYHPPPQIPPVAPPPATVGYGPYFGPSTPSSYISMPSSVAPPGRAAVAGHPGFGMGVAAGGALAAGAMIYGGDIMSGLQIPSASLDASVSFSTYPPF